MLTASATLFVAAKAQGPTVAPQASCHRLSRRRRLRLTHRRPSDDRASLCYLL